MLSPSCCQPGPELIPPLSSPDSSESKPCSMGRGDPHDCLGSASHQHPAQLSPPRPLQRLPVPMELPLQPDGTRHPQGYCQGMGGGSKQGPRTHETHRMHAGCPLSHTMSASPNKEKHPWCRELIKRDSTRSHFLKLPCALQKQEPLHELSSALSPATRNSRREALQLHRESSLGGRAVISVVLWLTRICRHVPQEMGCTDKAGTRSSPCRGSAFMGTRSPKGSSSYEVPY